MPDQLVTPADICRQPKSLLLRIAAICSMVLIIFVCQYFYHQRAINYSYLIGLIHEYRLIAPILFVLIYGLFVVLLVPTLPFNLAAGLLFGAFWGGLLTIIATTAGSVLAFLISRSIFMKLVHQYVGERMVNWLEDKVTANSWAIIAFVRLCAVLPTGPLNYMLGLTSMRFSIYVLGTVIFLVVPSMIVSAMGAELGNAIFSDNSQHVIQQAMLQLTGLTVLLFLIPLISRKLISRKFVDIKFSTTPIKNEHSA